MGGGEAGWEIADRIAGVVLAGGPGVLARAATAGAVANNVAAPACCRHRRNAAYSASGDATMVDEADAGTEAASGVSDVEEWTTAAGVAT